MIRFFTIAGFFLSFIVRVAIAGQSEPCCAEDHDPDLPCITTDYNKVLQKRHPWFGENLMILEQEIRTWEKEISTKSTQQQPIIEIPVVVHVVYNINRPEQNISDQQIHSQIAALNLDFRRLNPDTIYTPGEFRNVAADAGIVFRLATRAPSGNPTTGITRTPTTLEAFNHEDDYVKFDQWGGKNIWDRNKYLNIWVCQIEGNYVGYAQYPGGPSSTDGIVISFRRFGTLGTVQSPNNRGRTLTHEVGHWLNLRHIWGEEDVCGSSDLVNDTPDQEASYYGCPQFPQSSCGSNDMFMNYMDYTNDQCMNLFTHGQKNRMHAVLNGTRASLKTSNAFHTPDVSNFFCDTLNLLVQDQLRTTPRLPAGGYVTGNNFFQPQAAAQYFETPGYATIEGVGLEFGKVTAVSGQGMVYAALWNAVGNSKLPSSAPLATKAIPFSTIIQDVAAGRITFVEFDQPVVHEGPFFMGVIYPYMPGDTVALKAATTSARVNSWVMHHDNTWESLATAWNTDQKLALAVFPMACSYGVSHYSESQDLTIGPVPVTGDFFNLFVSGQLPDELVHLTITDMTGREVMRVERMNISSFQTISIPPGLIPGVYVVNIYNNKIFLRKKFLLNRIY